MFLVKVVQQVVFILTTALHMLNDITVNCLRVTFLKEYLQLLHIKITYSML